MALGNYRGPSFFKAFSKYVFALYERGLRDLGYRIFVTDALNNIPQMKYFPNRWYDTVKSNDSKSDKTAEEIVDDVIAALSGGTK